jgi:transposase-like protein
MLLEAASVRRTHLHLDNFVSATALPVIDNKLINSKTKYKASEL